MSAKIRLIPLNKIIVGQLLRIPGEIIMSYYRRVNWLAIRTSDIISSFFDIDFF